MAAAVGKYNTGSGTDPKNILILDTSYIVQYIYYIIKRLNLKPYYYVLYQTHIKEWMIWFQASSSYYIGHRCEYMIIYSEGFFSLSFTTEDSGSGHLVRSATNIMSHESQEASPLKNVGPSLSWDLSPPSCPFLLIISFLFHLTSSSYPIWLKITYMKGFLVSVVCTVVHM